MASIVPTGRHTPVSNISSEAVEIVGEQMEHPETGSEEGVVEADGEVEVALGDRKSGPLYESAAAASEALELPKLPDIGEASFGEPPKSVMEAVLGTDERVRITATRNYPYRAIASLLITARDGSQWIGTGWFISPRTLVTAGHCVFIKNSGLPSRDGWVQSIRVIAGRDVNDFPYGVVPSSHFWSVRGWTENGDENFDYGAIVIPEPLGQRVGTFGFASFSDAALSGQTINVTGYPGDKPAGTMWHDSRAIASVSPTKIHYELDTAGGQSGAPAYIIRNGKRYGVAVHAYGGRTTNSGTRISQPVYQNLRNWRA
jgi:V8-like Glu-specific endopeptidase